MLRSYTKNYNGTDYTIATAQNLNEPVVFLGRKQLKFSCPLSRLKLSEVESLVEKMIDELASKQVSNEICEK